MIQSDYIYETSTEYRTVTEVSLVRDTTTSFATLSTPLPTTIVQLSTIYIPLITSAAPLTAPTLSSSSVDLSIGLPLLPPATVTIYSNISIPYLSTVYELSTVLQPTTIVDLSTIYVPSPTTLVQLSSIFIPQPTTIFQVSTISAPQPVASCQQPVCLPIITTVSRVITLTFSPPIPLPSATTITLPQVTVTSLVPSIDYVYETVTELITSKSHSLSSSPFRLRSIAESHNYWGSGQSAL